MPFQIRTIAPEEFATFTRTGYAAFGMQATDAHIAWEQPIVEFDRTIAAFDHGVMIGTAGNISMHLTVPGGATLPAAGVTAVAVLPTYRRRGVLREMMNWLLADARRHGEPVAILNASESSIYGRFGYGAATFKSDYAIDRREATLRPLYAPRGHVRLLQPEETLEKLPAVYERASLPHPGALSRSTGWWQRVVGTTLPNPWPSHGVRYDVAYESAAGQIEGIAVYHFESRWTNGLASGELHVNLFEAATPEARIALWDYLLDLDLVQSVRLEGRPLDEPLRWLLVDQRRLRAERVVDDLWLRPLDIPATLTARRYATTGHLTFELTDSFRPQNASTYTLEAGPDGATCARATRAADLTLDVSDLGALYLGGVSVAALAQAGRVVPHTPDALQRAGALFSTPEPPYSGTPF